MKNYTGYARHHNQFSINVHLIKRYKKKQGGVDKLLLGNFLGKYLKKSFLVWPKNITGGELSLFFIKTKFNDPGTCINHSRLRSKKKL